MATITKRGPYQFQAIIRRKGYPSQTKTFESRKEAENWVSVIESEMVRGVFTDRSEVERTMLGEALDRYLRDVTPHKRGARQEADRIGRWKKHPLAIRSLASLGSSDFAKYRDDRLKVCGGNTVRLELAIISNLYTVAHLEWGLPVSNPILGIRKPELPPGRDRRLEGDEESRLLDAATLSRANPWLAACIRLAIETGMRAGEILSLDWSQVYLQRNIIKLEKTKNGNSRSVPLSREAVEILRGLPRNISGRVILAFGCTVNLDQAFKVACIRAGIQNLVFHDLRHEAASRFAPFMTVQTLAKVMGWKTLQMAMRYYNPLDHELVEAVRRANNSQ